jgi:hypothetical protein
LLKIQKNDISLLMSKNRKTPAKKGLLDRMIQKRADMIMGHVFSVPESVGSAAVIVSALGTKETELAEEHALRVAEDYAKQGDVELFVRPTPLQIGRIMTDRSVVSLVFIGHGSFSSYHAYHDETKSYDIVDWASIASMADHLKTGYFEQRTCGHLHKPDQNIRVALGSFVVVDQTRIRAAVGVMPPTDGSGYEEFEALMHQAYSWQNNDAEQLRNPIRVHA